MLSKLLVTKGNHDPPLSPASVSVTINRPDVAFPFAANAEGSKNSVHMWSLITFSAGPCHKVALVMPPSHPCNQIPHKRELISFLHKPLSWSGLAFRAICNAVQMREWLSLGGIEDAHQYPTVKFPTVSQKIHRLQIGVKVKRRPAGERPRQADPQRQMPMKVFNGVELMRAGR